ncbi:Hypothetical_protein [Hexamita inflata]|uniref:Hypothetical_protein n=1 Tax=Hexamita inflata TaxID=28002 RepID=A0AA86R7Q6_9EUKA|nr:Hypothetical protein HINF_LOCUS58647 [Hexamita inflata]
METPEEIKIVDLTEMYANENDLGKILFNDWQQAFDTCKAVSTLKNVESTNLLYCHHFSKWKNPRKISSHKNTCKRHAGIHQITGKTMLSYKRIAPDKYNHFKFIMLPDLSFVDIEQIDVNHMYYKLVITGEHDKDPVKHCQIQHILKYKFSKEEDELILNQFQSVKAFKRLIYYLKNQRVKTQLVVLLKRFQDTLCIWLEFTYQTMF